MKCKPECAPGGALSKTRLASCSGGILAGSTGECWRAAPARYWPDTHSLLWDAERNPLASRLGGIHWRWRDPLAGGMLGGIHWRATLGYSADTRRDPLASHSGGILHWRAALGYSAGSALPGYSAGATGGILGRIHTWRDPQASSSGGILGGIHWRAALASAGATGELLWRDTRRAPLASCSACSGRMLGGGVV